MLKDNLGRLRLLGILEGISYLLLFGVGMPLKYYHDMPEPNYVIGMVHGVLFIGYCLMVLIVAKQLKWSIENVLLALVASVLPFGTFVADKKLFRRSINPV